MGQGGTERERERGREEKGGRDIRINLELPAGDGIKIFLKLDFVNRSLAVAVVGHKNKQYCAHHVGRTNTTERTLS